MHNPAPVLENNTHKQTPMGLRHTHGSPNLGQKTRLNNNQQKERELAKLWTLLSQLTTE